MIAIDTNILVYAHRRDMPGHEQARGRLDGILSGGGMVAFCWPVVHEFLSIVTRTSVFPDPTPMASAFEQMRHWLSSPRATVLCETAGHLDVLEDLSLTGRAAGATVHDARIAALCIEHGVQEIWSADRDFTRFPTLKVVNPLVG